MKELQGKRALVTGAGSGLGRSLALALAGEGCRVGAADINEAGAAETQALVEGFGGQGRACWVDVADPASVRDMARFFEREWGGVDLLVNNAGIAVAGLVGEIPLAEWEHVVAVNLMGVIYGCHEFIPRMREQGGGHIVNIASFAGIGNLPEMAAYNATKAAVISLSETLRVELAPAGIEVTVVCPLFFKTGLIEKMSAADIFQKEFAQTCFDCSRIKAEQVAAKIVRAVKRGRFYLIPQRSGKVIWALKRFSPSAFMGTAAFLNRMGLGRPLLMRAARRGLL